MQKCLIYVVFVAGALIGGGYFLYRTLRPSLARSARLVEWIRNPPSRPSAGPPRLVGAEGLLGRPAPAAEAPRSSSPPTASSAIYRRPTRWDDSFKAGHRHQGIDIFGGTEVGLTPVVAAYPGYLTRLPSWKSSLIVRVPEDPLHPGRQVWLYYTHMADPAGNSFVSPEFPSGTYEKYVEAGTRLGYQGDYSGDPYNPVGVHLHFSIMLDNGQGNFRRVGLRQ